MTPPSLVDAVPYARPHPDGLALRNPPRDFVLQGLLVALLLPVAVVLLGLLFALMAGLRSDQTLAWAILGGLVSLASLICLLAGGVQVLLARRRSRSTEVVLDRSRQAILRGGESLVRWSDVAAVRAHKPSALLKWWGISAVTHDGTSILLLGKLPPSRAVAVGALAKVAAAELSVAVDRPEDLAATGALGISPHTAGALCYLPFQGIFLLASVWFALFSKDRFVRFCALQSLLQFALAMALLVPVVGCSGSLAFLLQDQVHPAAIAVGIAALIVPYQVWRIVARAVACWRAYHGRAWVMPWLGFVSRRWLPPEVGTRGQGSQADDPSTSSSPMGVVSSRR